MGGRPNRVEVASEICPVRQTGEFAEVLTHGHVGELRHRLVPGIADDCELEIVREYLLADLSADLPGGEVLKSARLTTVVKPVNETHPKICLGAGPGPDEIFDTCPGAFWDMDEN